MGIAELMIVQPSGTAQPWAYRKLSIRDAVKPYVMALATSLLAAPRKPIASAAYQMWYAKYEL